MCAALRVSLLLFSLFEATLLFLLFPLALFDRALFHSFSCLRFCYFVIITVGRAVDVHYLDLYRLLAVDIVRCYSPRSQSGESQEAPKKPELSVSSVESTLLISKLGISGRQ